MTDTVKPMPGDDFRKAADIMLERGLSRYAQEDSQGRVCVADALSIARYGKSYVIVGLGMPTAEHAKWERFRDGFTRMFGHDPVVYNNELAVDEADVAEKLKLYAEAVDALA